MLVYRVNWLRSKARVDRWTEEFVTVSHEMTWTVLWFENQIATWSRRAKRSEKGHKAYAEKQVAMWKMFKGEAKRGFEGQMKE